MVPQEISLGEPHGEGSACDLLAVSGAGSGIAAARADCACADVTAYAAAPHRWKGRTKATFPKLSAEHSPSGDCGRGEVDHGRHPETAFGGQRLAVMPVWLLALRRTLRDGFLR